VATTMSAPRTATENFNGIRFALMRTSLTARAPPRLIGSAFRRFKTADARGTAPARVVGLGWSHGSRSA
jgi:hypothetical protein